MSIAEIVITGAFSGLIGAFVMDLFMRVVSTVYSERIDMTQALGSFFTGKLENASYVGVVIHGISGTFFGVIYLVLV